MPSIPVVFASSRAARESNCNWIKIAKRIRTDAADISMEDSNSDSETDWEEPAQKSGQKYDGAAKYRVKYNPSWAKDYPVKAVLNDHYSFFCIPCGKSLSCQHIKDFVMSKYIVNEIHTGKKLKPAKRVILYKDFFQNLGILAAT